MTAGRFETLGHPATLAEAFAAGREAGIKEEQARGMALLADARTVLSKALAIHVSVVRSEICIPLEDLAKSNHDPFVWAADVIERVVKDVQKRYPKL